MSAADKAELTALSAALEADTWPEDIPAALRSTTKWGTPVAPDVEVREQQVGGVPAYLHVPPVSDASRVGLYLHGGGYVFGLAVQSQQYGTSR